MKVYGFKSDNYGIMDIVDTLEAQQMFVGGHIEGHYIAPDLMLICNEDGKYLGLGSRAAWIIKGKIIDIIKGDFFVCRVKNSEMVDIIDEDIPIIEDTLIPLILKL